MILLNEINQLKVIDYSVVENELEYVLVENIPENRKKIDLALAAHFNWAIISMEDFNMLTAGGNEIISEHTEDNTINVVGIIWDNLPEKITSKIGWSLATGFITSEDVDDFKEASQ